MISGYMNKILRVDLSTGNITEEPFPEDWKKMYLGGTGIAARIIYDEVPPDADAFDSGNVVCMFTGPYTGTSAPTSGRYGVATKSPLTGGWGESTASGYFGPEMKFAGFDGIIITGKSETPVYLWIDDGKADLLSAEELWGKTTEDTEKILHEKHGGKIRIASIGPAGEKLVRFSCVISDGGRAAGRCGIGAVMGSKNLKAVAVHGTQKVPVADADFDTKVKDYIKIIRESMGFQIMSQGTADTVTMASAHGDFPVKNWQVGNFPEAERLGLQGDYPKMVSKKWACYRCPIACGRIAKVDREIGGVKPFESHAPEYETLGVFGGAIQNQDVETVAAANYICNTYGMDTISSGGMISFAFEAYEKGILKKDDIGFELKWGDGEAAVKLVQMIAKREGIGELLGEGPKITAQKIGMGTDQFALHVKGMGIPAHDPRVYSGIAVEYAVSNRGACHLQGFMETWQSIELEFGELLDEVYKDKGLFWGLRFPDQHGNEGKGQLTYKVMAVHNTFDALPICKFMTPCDMNTGHEIASLISSILGIEVSRDDLQEIGERLVALKRSFNIRCGLTRADDRLPVRLLTPPSDTPDKHVAPNLEIQLKDFYKSADWDWRTGKPNKKRLEKLGLEGIAKDLWG